MRIVILAPSIYSETACAMAAHLAQSGHAVVGAISLRSLNGKTIRRKLAQWGVRRVVQYIRAKAVPTSARGGVRFDNSYLQPYLRHDSDCFRTLLQVAAGYGFPVTVRPDHNSPESIASLGEWSPDAIVFAGGSILRQPVLDAPRLGVINVHLALLAEIRGMSSPEWSLLEGVPLGITIHFMDTGIDTGPVLQRFVFPAAKQSENLGDLRNRLIAFGVEKLPEVISALERDEVAAVPQPDFNEHRQFFVMHERLRARAEERLATRHSGPLETVHG